MTAREESVRSKSASLTIVQRVKFAWMTSAKSQNAKSIKIVRLVAWNALTITASRNASQIMIVHPKVNALMASVDVQLIILTATLTDIVLREKTVKMASAKSHNATVTPIAIPMKFAKTQNAGQNVKPTMIVQAVKSATRQVGNALKNVPSNWIVRAMMKFVKIQENVFQ